MKPDHENTMRSLLSALIAVTLAVLCVAAEPAIGQVATSPAKGKVGKDHNVVKKAVAFGESLVGTPYKWSDEFTKKAPFWGEDGPPPDAAMVRKQGTNCVGLTNLMLRSIGKKVPGGTIQYGEVYKKVAQKFEVDHNYPEGTLLLRRYRNKKDQGHVGVVLKNGHVLEAGPGGIVNDKNTVKQSNGDGYYDYAVLPRYWLGHKSPVR